MIIFSMPSLIQNPIIAMYVDMMEKLSLMMIWNGNARSAATKTMTR